MGYSKFSFYKKRRQLWKLVFTQEVLIR
jgi:hypothetical protein